MSKSFGQSSLLIVSPRWSGKRAKQSDRKIRPGVCFFSLRDRIQCDITDGLSTCLTEWLN